MKNFFLSLVFCAIPFFAHSQNASVEQSTYGIQSGILGLWFHNEAALSEEIALRSELGFDTGLFAGSYYDNVGFLLAPVISLEPRWYYNLNKRQRKSRRTDGNSGNFLSLKTSYHPDWFVISNYDNISVASDISIVPTWGIRRHLGDHFTYETGIGFGYQYYLTGSSDFFENKHDAAINLHLRIGYRF
ncbi:hypothetical protein [Salinimicrobium sp. TH3]|uniref:hypothetical protein n=1 Tax=Salinimicrobium sp. TH3 TaxID=2997342 RepID=UPI002275EA6E|nr:hypothetical protein [Salinimicrobium sp. TH3]MCY2685648.1 hypothetical protein [Salinimicrobium sp. TH3]